MKTKCECGHYEMDHNPICECYCECNQFQLVPMSTKEPHIVGGVYAAIETAYGKTVDHAFNILVF